MRWFTATGRSSIVLGALLVVVSASIGSPALAQGTAAGTSIQNTAALSFKDSGGVSQPSVTSNAAATTVSQLAAVQTAPASGSGQGQATEVVYYAVTVTNQGNAADTFTLTAASASSPAWTTAFYKDDGAGGGTANDGIHQSGETTLAASTGSVAADATFKCFVAVTIPAGAAKDTVDTTTITATSQYDATKKDSGAFSTTVKAASMTLTKSVDKAQAAPGDTIRYTLAYSNSGSASATSVIITDNVPAAVTYVVNSVKLNSAAKTDAADGDQVTVSGGVITINLGTVTAGSSGTITFDAKVK